MVALGFSCNGLDSQRITIFGKAMDAKAGAIVISDDNGFYYLDGVDYWDKKFYGKKVKVTGILVIEKREAKQKEEEEIVQEIVGTKKIIRNSKWVLIE